MARSYLATKDILIDHEFDFAGIKCQTELSDFFVTQCMTVALANDIADRECSHTPTALACEADLDGALTMHLLQLLSGGKPTTLMDFQTFQRDNSLCLFANCGGMSCWFGARSENSTDNYAQVHLRPHTTGRAAAATTQFAFKSGPVTLARLCQKNGRYVLVAINGEAVDTARETLRDYRRPWPYAFVQVGCDPMNLVTERGANHVHAVGGNYIRCLEEYAWMMDMEIKAF